MAELDGEREALSRELSHLRQELAESEPPPVVEAVPSPDKPPWSREEKVSLFRSLFAGREDVFPRFWRRADLPYC